MPRPCHGRTSRDLVTGAHQYPSDLKLPDMLYGKVLRPPAYGAKLVSVDLAPARAMENVAVVQDGEFVGVAAPTSFQARQALDAVAQSAKWERSPHPSSSELFAYLRQQAEDRLPVNPFAEVVAQAAQARRQTYHVAYVQHVPLEPRVAVAQWQEGKLTVWTGTQAPFGYQGEIARAFRLPNENVRVVVPDFGSGFGGKHTARSGDRGGAPGPRRGASRIAAVDAGRGIHLGLFPPRGGDRDRGQPERSRQIDLLAFRQHQLRRCGRGYSLPSRPVTMPVRPVQRAVAARLVSRAGRHGQ